MPRKPKEARNPGRTANKTVGDSGERIAAAHLERLGWRVLATRFRGPQGEIDLIAEEPTAEGDVLVFIEVKCTVFNKSEEISIALQSVDATKQAG